MSGRSWDSARSKATVLFAALCLALTAVGGRMATAPPAAAADDVTAEVNVTADQPGPAPVSHSPSLSVNLIDSRVMALGHQVAGSPLSCGLHISTDSALTWRPARPFVYLPAGAPGCESPQVLFDRAGDLHVVFTATGTGTFLTTSTDRGATFSEARRILPASASGVRLDVDPTFGEHGRIQMVWLDGRVKSAHSDDGGATFSEPLALSDPAGRASRPAVTWGLARAVHVAWYDLGPAGQGNPELRLATSRDGAVSFGPARAIATGLVPAAPDPTTGPSDLAPPALAAARDLVCAAWVDASPGPPDVLARCSVNGGRDWAPQGRVDKGPWIDDRPSRFLPVLSVTLEGLAQVAYYERAPDGTRTDVFVTSSADAGRTFQPALRVTEAGFPVEGADLGNRLALQSRGTRVLTAWTDARRPAAPGEGRRQDVYVALAVVPVDDIQTETNPLLIPALLLMGLIGFVVYRGWKRSKADAPDPPRDLPEGSMVGG